ncbi:hypothetical protein [Actinomadura sp. 3N407]|uniref:hypothetical protein n=1 Tax=Actinomadura sp. 3N407 TaxID=3457423 RepID=UPI003FCE1B1D
MTLLLIGPLTGRLQERFPASALIAVGFAVSAAGFLTISRIRPGSDWPDVLPGFALIGSAGPWPTPRCWAWRWAS